MSTDAAGAVLTNKNIMACEMSINGRTVPAPGALAATGRPSWFCDANVDVNGDAVAEVGVTSRPVSAMSALLTIRARTSYDL
jgi:hypothetical protein